MQIAANDSMWPVLGGVKWVKNFHATVATSITAGQVVVGYVLWTVLRAFVCSTVFLFVAALLGAIPSAWAVLAIPASALCAARVRRTALRVFGPPRQRRLLPRDHAGRGAAAVPVLGHLLPDLAAPGLAAAVRGDLAVVARRGAGARAATTGTLHLGADLVHIAVLVACVGAGLLWGRRTFTRRLTA